MKKKSTKKKRVTAKRAIQVKKWQAKGAMARKRKGKKSGYVLVKRSKLERLGKMFEDTGIAGKMLVGEAGAHIGRKVGGEKEDFWGDLFGTSARARGRNFGYQVAENIPKWTKDSYGTKKVRKTGKMGKK